MTAALKKRGRPTKAEAQAKQLKAVVIAALESPDADVSLRAAETLLRIEDHERRLGALSQLTREQLLELIVTVPSFGEDR
jgi:hypothetical protein